MSYTLFRGAKVYRHELGWNSFQDEVLVKDNTILSYSDDHEREYGLPENTEIIDLEGGVLLPAFFDAHLHLDQGGKYLRSLQLLDITDKATVLEAIRNYPRNSSWMRGIGLHENAIPTLKELDRVSGDIPLLLHTRDYHTVVLNNRAINDLKLTKDTEFIEGGWQDFLQDGSPAGVLHENATMWLVDKLPKETEKDIRDNLLKAFDELESYGVLGVSDGSENSSYDILKSMDNASDLKIFVEHWYRCVTFNEPCLKYIPYKGKRFISNRIKLFLDGALGSRTAWMKEPYTDRPDIISKPVPDLHKLEKFVQKANEQGWGLTVHAIGDKAVEYGLDLVTKNRCGSVLNRLEHLQHISQETLDKIADTDVFVSVQPGHRLADLSMLIERVGTERANISFPMASLDNDKRRIVLGTDWPVISLNPFETVYAAMVKRENGEGMPNQHLSLEETLYSASYAGAKCAGFTDYGRTEKGGLGNFIWLSDIPTQDPESWRTCKPDKVFREGKEIKKGR